ncbi:MAG: hypothetical protein ACOVRK_02460 [Chryseobacterium taeanense]
MGFLYAIIQIYREIFLYAHLWNSPVGEYEYLIREILYNPRLLGSNKLEVRYFMRFYRLYRCEPEEWVYEVRRVGKRKYLLTLHFEQNKLRGIQYSYLTKVKES